MSNFPIPNPWSLLEAIETFPELTDEIFFLGTDFESFRLFHIDFLLQFPRQKCCHNVHLVNFQPVNCCNRDEDSDRLELDDWCVGISVIDSVDLTESPCDEQR